MSEDIPVAGPVKTYVRTERVQAEEIPDDCRVVTVGGVVDARKGDYLVYSPAGALLFPRDTFLGNGWEVEDDESRYAREFTPVGVKAEDVVAFLDEHPEQIDRVKELESQGGKRKTILEYTAR